MFHSSTGMDSNSAWPARTCRWGTVHCWTQSLVCLRLWQPHASRSASSLPALLSLCWIRSAGTLSDVHRAPPKQSLQCNARSDSLCSSGMQFSEVAHAIAAPQLLERAKPHTKFSAQSFREGLIEFRNLESPRSIKSPRTALCSIDPLAH